MRILFITILFFFTSSSFAQDSNWVKSSRTIGNEIADFTVDNLGNLFVLTKDNMLKKYNVKGDSVGVYNDVRRFGKVYSIDVTNPLKVLLYYKDFSTIVVLDRFLSIRNTVDLRKQGIFQAKAIGQSYDNGIWVYDELEAKLKKLNDEGAVQDATVDLRLITDTAPSPTYVTDQDRLVYLYDSTKGIIIFDYYGALKNKVALTGWQDLQVIGKVIYGRKNNLFESYEPGTLMLRERRLPSLLNGVQKTKISLNYLYCLKDGVIHMYAL